MEFTQDLADKINATATSTAETHDAVIWIKSKLGNGEGGILSDVRSHSRRIRIIELILAGGGLTGIGALLTRLVG